MVPFDPKISPWFEVDIACELRVTSVLHPLDATPATPVKIQPIFFEVSRTPLIEDLSQERQRDPLAPLPDCRPPDFPAAGLFRRQVAPVARLSRRRIVPTPECPPCQIVLLPPGGLSSPRSAKEKVYCARMDEGFDFTGLHPNSKQGILLSVKFMATSPG